MSEDDVPLEDQIADPEDIVQSRRLNSIFDIRDEIRQHRKTILMESYSNHGVSRFQALSGYRTLANNYLMELQPLLMKFEPGEELLNDHDLGHAVIVPNYQVVSSNSHGMGPEVEIQHRDGTSRVQEKPEAKQVELTGLESIWNTPDPLQAEFSLMQYDNINKTTNRQPIVITDQFSVNTTDKFIRSMNMFLSEIGFELEPDEDEDPAQMSL
jgi:hypothetical protein